MSADVWMRIAQRAIRVAKGPAKITLHVVITADFEST